MQARGRTAAAAGATPVRVGYNEWNLDMSKATHLPAWRIPSAASSQKTVERPLDPTILFTAIGLLALTVAVVFGQPGVWF
jgi:hypothetical protein